MGQRRTADDICAPVTRSLRRGQAGDGVAIALARSLGVGADRQKGGNGGRTRSKQTARRTDRVRAHIFGASECSMFGRSELAFPSEPAAASSSSVQLLLYRRRRRRRRVSRRTRTKSCWGGGRWRAGGQDPRMLDAIGSCTKEEDGRTDGRTDAEMLPDRAS